ncbi:hypothetical protein [Pinisolibacter aquiterrae]|uniref:hypothetical protein n=1 Tax=Pinisolibacter aquiterrae TaxID=2815579 RepID=UPI001C3CA3E1|nr:hypothetical protein [Pinisolibacter aquiterrae]MBV5264488.1 hypothetical protein [Pinisolibacter aquiterrae]MCC8234363.1 hypothetical protein [Pinisolibacter aquiterrae]
MGDFTTTALVAYIDNEGEYLTIRHFDDESELADWSGRGLAKFAEMLGENEAEGIPCFWGGPASMNPYVGVLPFADERGAVLQRPDAKHPARGWHRGGVGNADPIGVAISKNDITAPATIQAAKSREPHRYCVCIRPDVDGWEYLVVNQGGDSGGWRVRVPRLSERSRSRRRSPSRRRDGATPRNPAVTGSCRNSTR